MDLHTRIFRLGGWIDRACGVALVFVALVCFAELFELALAIVNH